MPSARQWLWFAALWAMGVGATAIMGYGLALWLR